MPTAGVCGDGQGFRQRRRAFPACRAHREPRAHPWAARRSPFDPRRPSTRVRPQAVPQARTAPVSGTRPAGPRQARPAAPACCGPEPRAETLSRAPCRTARRGDERGHGFGARGHRARFRLPSRPRELPLEPSQRGSRRRPRPSHAFEPSPSCHTRTAEEGDADRTTMGNASLRHAPGRLCRPLPGRTPRRGSCRGSPPRTRARRRAPRSSTRRASGGHLRPWRWRRRGRTGTHGC